MGFALTDQGRALSIASPEYTVFDLAARQTDLAIFADDFSVGANEDRDIVDQMIGFLRGQQRCGGVGDHDIRGR